MRGGAGRIAVLALLAWSRAEGARAGETPGPAAASLHGTVRELGTRKPVAGAEVTLDPGSFTAVCDARGMFLLDSLPTGVLEVRIAAYGYRLVRERVELTRSVEARVFDLPPDFGAVQEVDVIAPAPREASRRTIARAEMKAVPGTVGDPLRAVTALPGVAPASDIDSNLYVRGGGPNDNAIFADGIPAGYPYHYQGIASTFQADAVESLEFYSGGFPARFGDRMGGIFDLATRTRPEEQLTGTLGVSLATSYLTLAAPSPWPAGQLVLSARRGYFDFVLPRRVTEVAVPRYADYLVKDTLPLSNRDTLRLEAFGAEDSAVAEVTSRADPSVTGEFRWRHDFHVGGLTWTRRFDGGEQALTVTGGTTGNAVDLGQGYYFDQHPVEGTVRDEVVFGTGPHRTRVGAEGILTRYKLDAYFSRLPGEGQGTYSFTSLSKIRTSQAMRGGRGGGWVSDRWTPNPKVSVEGGARLDWYGLTRTLAPSPRLSGRVTLLPGLRVLGAGGLYRQAPQALELMPTWGNPRLEPSRAWHGILGLEGERGAWSGSLEAYDKEFTRLVTPDAALNYSNAGNGWARGAEVLVRRDFSERVAGWAGYARSVSKRRDGPGLPLRYSDYDVPHMLSLVVRALVTPAWNVSGRWRLATGTPYTPVTGEHPDAAGDPVPEFGGVNSARLPAYHRLDLHTEYTFRMSGWSIMPYLELLNAYHHRNLAAVVWSDQYGRDRRISQLPHAYFFGVEVRF